MGIGPGGSYVAVELHVPLDRRQCPADGPVLVAITHHEVWCVGGTALCEVKLERKVVRPHG